MDKCEGIRIMNDIENERRHQGIMKFDGFDNKCCEKIKPFLQWYISGPSTIIQYVECVLFNKISFYVAWFKIDWKSYENNFFILLKHTFRPSNLNRTDNINCKYFITQISYNSPWKFTIPSVYKEFFNSSKNYPIYNITYCLIRVV